MFCSFLLCARAREFRELLYTLSFSLFHSDLLLNKGYIVFFSGVDTCKSLYFSIGSSGSCARGLAQGHGPVNTRRD